MRAFIMAAGEGTRMWPLTENRPKPLLPLVGKPIIEYILDAVIDAGIDRITILIGREGRKIVSDIGHVYRDIRIDYRHQEMRVGTGNAALYAEEFDDDRFMFLNGDILFDAHMLYEIKDEENAVLAVYRELGDSYGSIEGNELLEGISEKVEGSRNVWINTGIYVFGREIFDALKACAPSVRGEIELTDAINILASRLEVRVIKSKGFWMDLGAPWDLLNALPHLMDDMESRMDGTVEENVSLKGNIVLGEGSVIKSGTYIEGPVHIGRNTVVGPSAYIRPYSVIGNNCHIGNSSEIKASIVMDGTKIPHFNYVGDSVIGERCNFGAGTKVANLRLDERNIRANLKGRMVDTGRRKLGVIMGDEVHTGINASILPGSMIGSGVSIGPSVTVNGLVKSGTRIL